MTMVLIEAEPYWERTWWGNSLVSWAIAGVAAVVGAVLLLAVVVLVRRVVMPRAAHADAGPALRALSAALSAIRLRWLILIAVFVALDFLEFTERTEFWLGLFTFALVGVQLVLCINRALVTLLLRSVPDREQVPVMLSILTWVVQLVIWLTLVLAWLSQAGVHITAFVASLGVGGIAVALALQNILGDLFASIAIGLDKPFEPGDFIMFGEEYGTVERVGVKTTRITSLSGEELAIGNAKLLDLLIHNYSRMPERRIAFSLSVRYGASREQLRQITDRTNAAIAAQETVRFDRGHLIGFGDVGFDFEFVYYILDSDYTLYLDTQQRINDEIIGILDDLGVAFAVPARAVEIDRGSDG